MTPFAARFGDDMARVVEVAVTSSRAFWADAELHRIWRMKIREARVEVARRALLAAGYDDPALAADIGEAFVACRQRAMHLFPGTREGLTALRQAGIRLALVTNGATAVQRAKIERFDLAGYFDHIQIEGEFGLGKPEPAVYRHLLTHFAAEPGDVWMIGDNLEWEVAAPRRLGITGIWFDGYRRGLPADATIRPDRIVSTLSELLDGAPAAHGLMETAP